jgi:hypothetical protein
VVAQFVLALRWLHPALLVKQALQQVGWAAQRSQSVTSLCLEPLRLLASFAREPRR